MHVPRTIYTLHKGNNKNSLELNTNTKMVKKNSKISLFVLAQLTNVTDRHRVTAIIAALCIASHGKNGVITHNSNRHAVQYKSSTGDSLISREVSYTGWMLSTGFGSELASRCSVEDCGYTRTRGFTRPDPYPRVRVGSGTCSTGTSWVG